MKTQLLDMAVEKLFEERFAAVDAPLQKRDLKPAGAKKVRDRTFAYSHRHRGNWFAPEYDFSEIQIAQDTDSYLHKAVKKKVDKFRCAGWELVSNNLEALQYLQARRGEIEMSTSITWNQLIVDTAHDLSRFNNCIWVKVRDNERSSGRKRKDIRGVELDPVAGYFILPMETLIFKTRSNGEIKKVMQRMPDGTKKEFLPSDIIHFFSNKKPGFTVGTPELLPALDDIALLRRLEENIEELIETNLFPVFHYKVGSDMFPERFGPDGMKETDVVKQTIEYMPSGGIYVSDHRHSIEAIGSESKALRAEAYLQYFKNRVFAAIGTSAIDMGEGAGANRSTASTISKTMSADVEALQQVVKQFLESAVINELLLEGGWNPLDPDDRVQVKFGVVDRTERMALENQAIQLFSNNVLTQTEARKELGLRPLTDEDQSDTFYKLYTEPLALIKSMGPGSAAGDVLANTATSNMTPEAVESEKQFEREKAKEAVALKKAGQAGAQGGAPSAGAGRQSANRARPANQRGTRTGPKLSNDLTDEMRTVTIVSADGSLSTNISVAPGVSEAQLIEFQDVVQARWAMLQNLGVSFDAVTYNLLWRLN